MKIRCNRNSRHCEKRACVKIAASDEAILSIDHAIASPRLQATASSVRNDVYFY